jgi:hypothetical protein
MTVLLLLTPAVGAILGVRFKTFVLAPATFLVSAFTIAIGVASGHDTRFILVVVFAGLALLQMGYFIGSVLHAYLTFKHKERHRRTVWSPTHFY